MANFNLELDDFSSSFRNVASGARALYEAWSIDADLRARREQADKARKTSELISKNARLMFGAVDPRANLAELSGAGDAGGGAVTGAVEGAGRAPASPASGAAAAAGRAPALAASGAVEGAASGVSPPARRGAFLGASLDAGVSAPGDAAPSMEKDRELMKLFSDGSGHMTKASYLSGLADIYASVLDSHGPVAAHQVVATFEQARSRVFGQTMSLAIASAEAGNLHDTARMLNVAQNFLPNGVRSTFGVSNDKLAVVGVQEDGGTSSTFVISASDAIPYMMNMLDPKWAQQHILDRDKHDLDARKTDINESYINEQKRAGRFSRDQILKQEAATERYLRAADNSRKNPNNLVAQNELANAAIALSTATGNIALAQAVIASQGNATVSEENRKRIDEAAKRLADAQERRDNLPPGAPEADWRAANAAVLSRATELAALNAADVVVPPRLAESFAEFTADPSNIHAVYDALMQNLQADVQDRRLKMGAPPPAALVLEVARNMSTVTPWFASAADAYTAAFRYLAGYTNEMTDNETGATIAVDTISGAVYVIPTAVKYSAMVLQAMRSENRPSPPVPFKGQPEPGSLFGTGGSGVGIGG